MHPASIGIPDIVSVNTSSSFTQSFIVLSTISAFKCIFCPAANVGPSCIDVHAFPPLPQCSAKYLFAASPTPTYTRLFISFALKRRPIRIPGLSDVMSISTTPFLNCGASVSYTFACPPGKMIFV